MNEGQEISSQVERAKKLFGDLKNEMNKDLQAEEVNLEIRNLTEEIFVKLRICLDKVLIYKLKAIGFKGDLSKVSFPISKNKLDFDSLMKKMRLTDLNQDFIKLLESFQPFSIDGNKYFYILHEKGSKEKHHFLVKERKGKIHSRTTFSNMNGGGISWTPDNVRFGGGVSIMGVPINIATQEPAYVLPHQQLIRHYDILFKLEDYEIELTFLLNSLVKTTEKIIREVLK